jgi:hypothetical protein
MHGAVPERPFISTPDRPPGRPVRRWSVGSVALLLTLGLGAGAAAAEALRLPRLVPLTAGGAPGASGASGTLPATATPAPWPAPWRVAGLPKQKPALTRYAAARIDGRDALKISAQASYGNFVFDAPGRDPPARLAWSWQVERANPTADLRTKAGDDTVARVCLSFDLPLDRVPFFERQLLAFARDSTGEHLPAATLCWVWGRQEARDSVIPNPYSRRVRYIVVRDASDGTGRWVDENRDVAADFRRAFGDESPVPPPLLAVVVAGDADNTRADTVAYVADLRVP